MKLREANGIVAFVIVTQINDGNTFCMASMGEDISFFVILKPAENGTTTCTIKANANWLHNKVAVPSLTTLAIMRCQSTLSSEALITLFFNDTRRLRGKQPAVDEFF